MDERESVSLAPRQQDQGHSPPKKNGLSHKNGFGHNTILGELKNGVKPHAKVALTAKPGANGAEFAAFLRQSLVDSAKASEKCAEISDKVSFYSDLPERPSDDIPEVPIADGAEKFGLVEVAPVGGGGW